MEYAVAKRDAFVTNTVRVSVDWLVRNLGANANGKREKVYDLQ